MKPEEKKEKVRDRSVSPVFEIPADEGDKKHVPKMMRNGDVSGDGILKIHRIPLVRTARCTVAYVTSPSCVWLKLVNHITSNLVIHDLNDLKPAPVIAPNRYVMAPLESGVYARARTVGRSVKDKDGSVYTRVLFIDEGYTRWLCNDALAKMDESFSFHPWQAIATSLFKVSPVSGKWTDEDCAALRDVIADYSVFKAEVVLNSVISNDYRQFIKVNLYGLENEKDEKGTSIACEFSRRRGDAVLLDREAFDGSRQEQFYLSVENEGVLKRADIDAMENWQKKFPEKETPQELEDDPQNSAEHAVGPLIPLVEVEWLQKEGFYTNGSFRVNVEGRHTVSPYEFYARPLKMSTGSGDGCDGADEEAAMIAANEELCAFADQLNLYYGHPKNRKIINAQRVKEELEAGKRVYGIVEVDGEIARFTGCWQRIEILGLKREGTSNSSSSYYCRIRFLDSGGTDIRLLSNIIEISPMHCTRPPFCLQLCLQGVSPYCGGKQRPVNPADLNWSDESRKFFYRELREDVPIALNVCGRLNSDQDGKLFPYECSAYKRPNVIFVNCIQVMDGSPETLDSRLVYQKFADISPNRPVHYGD